MAQQSKGTLEEKDWLDTILCDLKRSTREYATAVTESNCQTVRQEFTKLLNSTLTLQGNLYELMKQNNMYNASSPVLASELQKQIQQYQQSGQQAFQFAQTQGAQAAGQTPAFM
ncbi:spore coat protein [Gorillibacterium timonense]|uniref:spore coat protein n=1 Tax=Gorillibacterium timonense TaxID=1689269 RepID=UPI00071CE1A9|nr:spore coat protein [Gorillibacterium timonense]